VANIDVDTTAMGRSEESIRGSNYLIEHPVTREISFETLCENCYKNGQTHQEYGRICPHPSICLLTHKIKNKENCPIWRELKIPK
jgi:hypothetical protein